MRGLGPAEQAHDRGVGPAGATGSSIGIDRDRATSALGGGTATIADRPVASQEEAAALARSVGAHLGNAFVEAEGTSHGDPRLRAGTKIRIEGVGDKFTGTYSLSSTTHVFRGTRGYETNFVVSGRVARGLVDLARPAARRAWGDGVVVGVVTQNEDPEALGRVRVKYPALGDQTEGWWARISSPSAGEGRGLMMMPIAGDEVLLAFEHGDVRRPIVIGSLFNGKSKPGSLSQTDGSFALGSDKAVAIAATAGVTIKSGQAMQISSDGAMQVTTHQDHELDAKGDVTIQRLGGDDLGQGERHDPGTQHRPQGGRGGTDLGLPGGVGVSAHGGNPILGSGLAFPLGVDARGALSRWPTRRATSSRRSAWSSAPLRASGRCGPSSAAAFTTTYSNGSMRSRSVGWSTRSGLRSSGGSPGSRCWRCDLTRPRLATGAWSSRSSTGSSPPATSATWCTRST